MPPPTNHILMDECFKYCTLQHNGSTEQRTENWGKPEVGEIGGSGYEI